MVNAGDRRGMLDVVHHARDGVHLLVDERRQDVDADHPARPGDGPEAGVGEVAMVLAQRVRR